MIYEIFNQKHLHENAIAIMIVKVISTDIWDHKRVLVSTVANKRIYIYMLSLYFYTLKVGVD